MDVDNIDVIDDDNDDMMMMMMMMTLIKLSSMIIPYILICK